MATPNLQDFDLMRGLQPDYSSYTQAQLEDTVKKVRDALFGEEKACLDIANEFGRVFGLIAAIEKPEGDAKKDQKTEVRKELEDVMTGWIRMFVRLPEEDNSELLWSSLKSFVFLFSEWLNRTPEFTKKQVRIAVQKLASYDIFQLLRNRPPDAHFVTCMMNLMFPILRQGESIKELAVWLNDKEISTNLWESWGARLVQILVSNEKKDAEQFIAGIMGLLKDKENVAKYILKEVALAATKTTARAESEAMRSISTFIEKFSQSFPSLFFSEFAQLVFLLNSESHYIRIGIVNAIKSYILFMHSEQCDVDPGTKMERAGQLFDILEQRKYDKHAFARGRVLEAMLELVKARATPLDRFLQILKIAKERLRDTHAIVRKNAGKLLFVLICNNKLEEQQILKSAEDLSQKFQDNERKLKELQMDEDPEAVNVKSRLMMEQEMITNYLDMVNDLAECANILFQLLDSTSVNDITIAIEDLFIMQYIGLSAATRATIRIIPHIWRKDEKAKKDLLSGFHGLYTNRDVRPPNEGLAALTQLYLDLTPGERSSLEEVLRSMWEKDANFLDASYFDLLKQEFRDHPSVPLAFFLRCGCKAMRESYLAFYETIAQRALKDADSPWKMMEELLLATSSLGETGEKSQVFIAKVTKRLMDDRISFVPAWFCCAEQLIRTMAGLSRNPLSDLQMILVSAMKPVMQQEYKEEDLAKCMFVAGEIGLQVMKIIDRAKGKVQKMSEAPLSAESEMDQISGIHQAEKIEKMEYLKSIQSEKVAFSNILGHFPAVIDRCLSRLQDYHPLTQMSVSLAMSKFMCLSEKYCERQLSYFLTLLGNSGLGASLRCNLIVTFGDLINLYPNLVEQQIDFLFATLKDESPEVRRKAMLVITHLVNSAMVKLKSHTADILLMLLDEDATTKNLANLFLETTKERQQEIIVNAIPEALSKLAESRRISREQFEIVADRVINMIKTEKQQSSFIDHLCQKLFLQDGPGKPLLCYCIAQATKSEFAIRKLLDNLTTWQSLALDQPEIKKLFESALIFVSKNTKKEESGVLEEFATRLNIPIRDVLHKVPGKGKKPTPS